MSEKKRQKKDGERTEKKNNDMRTAPIKPAPARSDFPKEERNPGLSRSGGKREQ